MQVHQILSKALQDEGLLLLRFCQLGSVIALPKIRFPVQFGLVGACIGAGLVLAVFVSLSAGFVLAGIGLIGLAVLWRCHGWKAWHADAIFESIQHLPIPIAIYDTQDRLIVYNDLYSEHHPHLKDRKPDRFFSLPPSYKDIVLAGLSAELSPDEKSATAEKFSVAQPPEDGMLREREFPRVGWLRVGKRRLLSGGNVRVAIDINDLKARETELVSAVEQAQEADRAKFNFLSTMTHELRTPLNGIIGMASVVLHNDLDDRTRRNVEMLRGSGLHLLDLVNRVLDFSKINSKAVTEEEEVFNLHELVEEVVNETRFNPSADDLTVTAEIAPDVWPTWRANRTALRQLLTNLAGNAVKFTERGGVTLRVTETNTGISIDVEDTGIGIPTKKIERIFEAFEQADATTTRRYGGTGLGLAICADIVEAMSGDISVTSEVGVGSCFHVDLPLKAVDRELPVKAAS
jgi:signal transduction histidine kinase